MVWYCEQAVILVERTDSETWDSCGERCVSRSRSIKDERAQQLKEQFLSQEGHVVGDERRDRLQKKVLEL